MADESDRPEGGVVIPRGVHEVDVAGGHVTVTALRDVTASDFERALRPLLERRAEIEAAARDAEGARSA